MSKFLLVVMLLVLASLRALTSLNNCNRKREIPLTVAKYDSFLFHEKANKKRNQNKCTSQQIALEKLCKSYINKPHEVSLLKEARGSSVCLLICGMRVCVLMFES